MRLDYGKQKYAWLRILRFAVQAACLIASIAGFYYLVQGMGLPKAAFIAVVVLTGLSFCGWFCPFGTVQEWLRHIGKSATGVTLVIPRRLNRYLLLIRYVMPLERFL